MKAKLFDIQRFSIHDGPGIRTTVFFKGCNLRCIWCHNPESQSFDNQLMLYKDKCISCGACERICSNTHTPDCIACGKCAESCPGDARKICGYEMTAHEVYAEIIKDTAFYKASNGGATFSGGEPMLQADFLREVLKLCKDGGIHTCIETAANVPQTTFEKILPYTDLILCDIKAIDEEKHINGTGVSNKQILKNIEMLKNSHTEVLFRMPVIPRYNDDEISAASALCGEHKLEILKYHNMCKGKYDALSTAFGTCDIEPMTDEQMADIAEKYPNTIYNPSGI